MSRIATARSLARRILETANKLNFANYEEYLVTQTLGAPLAQMIEMGIITQVTEDALGHMADTLSMITNVLNAQVDAGMRAALEGLSPSMVALDNFANPVDTPRFELGQWVLATSLTTGATMRRRVADISDYLGTYVFGLEGPRGLVTIADNDPTWRLAAELPLAEGDVVRVRLVENGADGPCDLMKISAIDIADEDAPRTFWLMATVGASIAMFPVAEGDEAWSLERVPTLDEVLATPEHPEETVYVGQFSATEGTWNTCTPRCATARTAAAALRNRMQEHGFYFSELIGLSHDMADKGHVLSSNDGISFRVVPMQVQVAY